MGASIVSVLENNKNANIIFHIFTDGYSDENAVKLESIAKKWRIISSKYGAVP